MHRMVANISGSANAIDARDHGLLRTFPEIVYYPLKTYVTFDNVMDAYQDRNGCYQTSNMSEMDYADQLYTRAPNVGLLSLRARFSDNISSDYSQRCSLIFETSQPPTRTLCYVNLCRVPKNTGRTTLLFVKMVTEIQDTRGRSIPLAGEAKTHMIESPPDTYLALEKSHCRCYLDEILFMSVRSTTGLFVTNNDHMAPGDTPVFRP